MKKLPDIEVEKLKKRNRIKKLSPKTHKVEREAGSSLKNLWARINNK